MSSVILLDIRLLQYKQVSAKKKTKQKKQNPKNNGL